MIRQVDQNSSIGEPVCTVSGQTASHALFLEVPAISATIFEGLVGRGYPHAALEFSPFAAIAAEDQLRSSGFASLEQYLTTEPGFDSIAFLDWKEEAEMAARSSKRHHLRMASCGDSTRNFMARSTQIWRHSKRAQRAILNMTPLTAMATTLELVSR